MKNADSEGKLKSLLALIDLMKIENRTSLGFIIHHIAQISLKSSENLMTVENLAIIIAPTILRQRASSISLNADALVLPDLANILEYMVDHKDQLFPESLHIFTEMGNAGNSLTTPKPLPAPAKHNFVLLVANEKTYGSCIVYYDPFHEAELPVHISRAVGDPRGARIWAPRCICFVSRYPFSDIFLSVLNDIYNSSLLHSKIARNEDSDDENIDTLPTGDDIVHIEPIVQLITEEMPIPIPGFLAIDFSVNESNYTCAIPRVGDFPFASCSVASMFDIFSIRTWLKLFNAFILEQRIILVSEHLNLLTSVAEALCACMFPFKWQRIYQSYSFQ